MFLDLSLPFSFIYEISLHHDSNPEGNQILINTIYYCLVLNNILNNQFNLQFVIFTHILSKIKINS